MLRSNQNFRNKMHEEHVISLRGVGVALYASLLSVCQDGYSLSQTPVPGFEESEVLARINESDPLTSIGRGDRGSSAEGGSPAEERRQRSRP